MSTVETVNGQVDASELGVTLIHEHLRFRDEAVAENWPGRYDEQAELDAALEATRAAQEHGVKTIVDPTAMFGGRDVRFMKRVSDETGVNIAFCTGIYTYDYLPHYFENRDEDAIAQHFVDDIVTGTQGTDMKAAFLKCAADAAGVTEHVEKVHRACARASVQTGAPIMAHSMPAANTGPRQVEIFLEEGVAPEKIQIAHCGDSPDPDYVEGLLKQGVYVGLDRYGLDMYLPMDQRNAVTAELLRRGHAERLMISQDFCATIDWFPPEVVEQLKDSPAIHNWSFTLVFEEVVPWLREQGVMDDAVFETVFVHNPARWLARCRRAPARYPRDLWAVRAPRVLRCRPACR
jgi:phosphotriesterase-related protein